MTKNFNNFLYHKDISDNFIYVSPEIRDNYEMHTDLNIEKNDVFVLGLIMLELNIFKSVKHVNNDINIKNELL